MNIVPGEGQMSISFTLELGWAALSFSKNFSADENHVRTKRKVEMMLSKCLHSRLKCVFH